MAGILTVVRTGYPVRIGHGIKMVRGKVGWAAASGYMPTSGIEKYFRRCYKIDIALRQSSVVDCILSNTHKAGLAIMRMQSGAATTFPVGDNIAAASGVFTAFGL
jgi:hypothetical protein